MIPQNLGEPSKCHQIRGDGNCMFRALSYAVTGRQIYHSIVRAKILSHMKEMEELFCSHMDSSFVEYLARTKMNKNGVWGTDVEILSAASLLRTDIYVYTKLGNTHKWYKFSRTMLDGKLPDNDCSIYIKHTNGVHYDVVLDVTSDKGLESSTGDQKMEFLKGHNAGNQNAEANVGISNVKQFENVQNKQKRKYTTKLQQRDTYLLSHEDHEPKNKKMQSCDQSEIRPAAESVRHNLGKKLNTQSNIKQKNVAKDKKVLHDHKRTAKEANVCKSNDLNQTVDKQNTSNRKQKKSTNNKKGLHDIYEEAKSVNVCNSNDLNQTANEQNTSNQEQNTSNRKQKIVATDKKGLHHINKEAKSVNVCKTNTDLNQTASKQNTNNLKRTFVANDKKGVHEINKKAFKEAESNVCQSNDLNQSANEENANTPEGSDESKENISKFHKSMEYSIYQCTICLEAWPLKSKPKSASNYVCSRCARDKQNPKKFSKQNAMIPSSVPPELQGLTQIEEMLIARALPIMRVYVKPGGQRGYSGHCINLPQDVTELASSLPRYPKEVPLVVVSMKGKGNTLKDVTVRRQRVQNALQWLITNNPQYKELKIDLDSLNSLPENGVPPDLQTVEIHDTGLDNSNDETSFIDSELVCDSDIVFDKDTETSSFVPLGQNEQLEIKAIQSEIAAKPVDWPTVKNEPLNEFKTPYLATMAFPTLFPDGKGDPTNPSLYTDIPFCNRIKHLIKCAERSDRGWVYRFAKHPRFPYWALNMIQRKRTLQQSSVFLKQNPGESHLTIEQLHEMASNNSCTSFMTKLSRYVSNITGSNAYWHKIKEELKAIITNEGVPTIFFTFSSADMHWPELHSLFAKPPEKCTSQERKQHVIDNPHIVDWFFSQRLESFLKHWLYDSLGAKWHWYRYEFQARGSIHCHGTAKLKNDPGLCKLTEIALKGFLAQKHAQQNVCDPNQDVLQDIENGRKATATICNYVDTILSTFNPQPPVDNNWTKPIIHPCKRRHKDIPHAERDMDYVELLNTVQRHTHCSTNYCLRHKQNESDLQCRFKFPFDHCDKTRLEFEQVNTKDKTIQYRAKIVTKRNDSRLNNHQRLQLQGWRANCDIQVIIDHHACIEYLAKYAAKGEPRSPQLKDTFNSIIQNSGCETNPQKMIKKVMMKTLGERDFSSQETMHLLLSLKLHSTTFIVIPVSLIGSRRVQTYANKNHETCTTDSFLDIYAK